MKKLLFIMLSSLLLAACGGDTKLGQTSSTTSTSTSSSTSSSSSSSSSNSVRLGSGTGSSFQSGVLNMGITGTLSAGGTTNITATLVNSDGTLYTTSSTVTFSSTCIAAGTASIQDDATSVTTSTGSVSVTYVAQGCTADTVTATATVNGLSLSATGTLTIAAAQVGSIIFVSATPDSIALKGAGTSSMPEVSRVKFQVLDAQNNAAPNQSVTFSLNTTVGGVALSSTSETSDSSGYAEAIVTSGTVATSVRVTATVTSTSISTQSSNLTITTGLPDQDSFSMALTCQNLEAYDYDGVTTTATLYLADRFNNPVPDDTAVTIQAEAGSIGGSCKTSDGTCAVTWTSSGTRPTDGRLSLLATAIGEETFVDVNGNGVFDNNDTFTDVAEPFEDDDEDGSHDSGEPFRDFNKNGSYNLADGKFNGICPTTSTSDYTASASCSSTQQTLAIGAKGLIIMSGKFATGMQFLSAAQYSACSAGTLCASTTSAISSGTLTSTSVSTYYVTVVDARGNPMPSGTTVSFSSDAGKLSGTTSYTVGCSTAAAYSHALGTNVFPIKISQNTETDAQDVGVLTISVTTPKGNVTTLTIDVSNL